MNELNLFPEAGSNDRPLPNPNRSYYKSHEDWQTAQLLCPRCQWHGEGRTASLNMANWEVTEVNCPTCGEGLTLISHSTIEEMRADWDKLTPTQQRDLEDLERRHAARQRLKLKSADQLPEIRQPSFSLTWDHQDDETLIKHGNQVIWAEPAYYECYERFIQVAEILRQRYGTAIRDLVPTERSSTYLYGDRLSSPGIVQAARDRIFATPQPEPSCRAAEARITAALAHAVCKRITNQTRRRLQSIKGRYRLSGDDSTLQNLWEEVCVQLQGGEESVPWSVYEETIRGMVTGSAEALPAHEAEAVWLQTDDARENREDLEMENGEEGIGTLIDKVVDYLIEECVYPEALKWHNARIEAYLDRPTD